MSITPSTTCIRGLDRSARPASLVSTLVLILLVSAPSVGTATGLGEALTEGEVGLSLRTRTESVQDDRFPKRALGSSARLRANYQTAEWWRWTGFVEVDHVLRIGAQQFDDGSGQPERGRYPIIADPDGTDLNQLWVRKQVGAQGFLVLGRQRIAWDNQRFIGAVGWRQNEQTFDAVRLGAPGPGGVALQYVYLANVNRIFGDRVEAGDHAHSSHLLRAERSFEEGRQLTAYLYDLDNEDVAQLSSRTLGLRWTSDLPANKRRAGYALEYARQASAGANPRDYGVHYYRGELTVALLDTTRVTGGVEKLSSDGDGSAFQTPLATGHAFNGWADRFLSTPPSGLFDRFVKLRGAGGAWNWALAWHHFKTDAQGRQLGYEIDASLQRVLSDRYTLLIKLADFHGKAHDGDITKMWLMLSAEWK